MALKTAKMFKDFIISPNSDNSSVTFTMHDPVDVFVKNDNFASEILVKATDVDFYAYRYITFDNEAVFEITDVIKNKDYFTLFVQYISNISFETENENFYVNSVSAYTLQRLGMNMTEFISAVGNNGVFEVEDSTGYPADNPANEVIYGVRLRLSELPQNLSRAFYVYRRPQDNTPVISVANVSIDLDPTWGQRTCVQSSLSQKSPTDGGDFLQFENAVTVFIPIPHMRDMGIYIYDITDEESQPEAQGFTLGDFMHVLSALITDLTLSAEITIFRAGDLYAMGTPDTYDVRKNPTIISNFKFIRNYKTNASSITYNAIAIPLTKLLDDEQVFPCNGCIRALSDNDKQPIFLFYAQPNVNNESLKFDGVGLWERSTPFQLKVKDETYDNKILLQIRLLNNLIDVSELKNDFIVLQRFNGYLRVYVDFDRNIYIDIQTSFEYAKNAYSNYEAYKSANLDLVQAQEKATLRQTQNQNKRVFDIEQNYAVANASIDALKSLLSGDFSGALYGGINNALNIKQQRELFNIKQQNEAANLKLAQAQARETATETIIPSTDLTGSLSFLTAFLTNIPQSEESGKFSLFSLRTAQVNDTLLRYLERYVFDQQILDRIETINDIRRPIWQKLHNYYQMKISKANPREPRKDLIIYVFGGEQVQKAAQASFISGSKGTPTVEQDTGYVGNISNNGGAGVSWNFFASEKSYADVTVYVTARRYASYLFNDVWRIRYQNAQTESAFPLNPTIPQGEYATEWTRSYPLFVGRIPLAKGQNSIILTTKTPLVTDGNGNIDKIEISTDAVLSFTEYEH